MHHVQCFYYYYYIFFFLFLLYIGFLGLLKSSTAYNYKFHRCNLSNWLLCADVLLYHFSWAKTLPIYLVSGFFRVRSFVVEFSIVFVNAMLELCFSILFRFILAFYSLLTNCTGNSQREWWLWGYRRIRKMIKIKQNENERKKKHMNKRKTTDQETKQNLYLTHDCDPFAERISLCEFE